MHKEGTLKLKFYDEGPTSYKIDKNHLKEDNSEVDLQKDSFLEYLDGISTPMKNPMEDSRSPARSHECRDFADPSSMVQSPPPPYGRSLAASLTDMNGNGKTDDRSNSFRFPADNIAASHSNNPEEHRGPSNVYNNFLDVMGKMADNVNNQLEMLRDEKILNRMLRNTIDILRDDNENKAIRINEVERTIEIMNNQSQESTVTKCSDHRSHDNGQGQPEFILESQENQKTPAELTYLLKNNGTYV
eukprot:Seg3843.1 transcript_id=Seg3843.1/GoldUCD/mRNA.D3Y31 product="hypothetical protein" protein_id=Seg3843.1/GoldUCD/D3Y31